MKLSHAMKTMLHQARRGPFKCGNTNATANGLRDRGLIKLAPDQTATISFQNCYVITDAGAKALEP